MIRKYSLAKDGAKLLAPDFKVRELRCRDGSDTVMVDDALMLLLQCIREYFGKAVTITAATGRQRTTRPWAVPRAASTCWVGRQTSGCRA